MLRFVFTVNSQNFMKIVEAVFQKTKIFNFFLMWNTLHFEGRSKNKRQEIFARGSQISNLNEIGLLVYALRRATDRQTHRHFFSNTFLDCGSDVEPKIIKKSKSNFLTIAILPSLLMSLESKNELNIFAGDHRYWMWTRLASWFRRYVRRRTENWNLFF